MLPTPWRETREGLPPLLHAETALVLAVRTRHSHRNIDHGKRTPVPPGSRSRIRLLAGVGRGYCRWNTCVSDASGVGKVREMWSCQFRLSSSARDQSKPMSVHKLRQEPAKRKM